MTPGEILANVQHVNASVFTLEGITDVSVIERKISPLSIDSFTESMLMMTHDTLTGAKDLSEELGDALANLISLMNPIASLYSLSVTENEKKSIALENLFIEVHGFKSDATNFYFSDGHSEVRVSGLETASFSQRRIAFLTFSGVGRILQSIAGNSTLIDTETLLSLSIYNASAEIKNAQGSVMFTIPRNGYRKMAGYHLACAQLVFNGSSR